MKNKKVLSSLFVALIVSIVCVSNIGAKEPFPMNAAGEITPGDTASFVTVGQNFYGDALLGQIYQTHYEYSTRIKVINTSDKLAVVAKVVFRSALCSQEVLDFLIYLTPTDMWEGIIRLDASGKPIIFSEDDSVMRQKLTPPFYNWDGTAACNPFGAFWAKPNTTAEPYNAFTAPLTGMDTTKPAYLLPTGDTNLWGHFEVFGLAAYPATAPMSKDTLAMMFGNLANVPDLSDAAKLKLIECDFNLDGPAVPVPNILTGIITLESAAFDQVASINMVALKNWNRVQPIVTAADGSGRKLTQTETTLFDSKHNSVPEIEAALAKTEYSIPFDFSPNGYGDIVLIDTMPTHYIGTNTDPRASSGIFTNADKCQQFPISGTLGYKVYDMKETQLIGFLSPFKFKARLPEVSMQSLRPLIAQLIALGFDKGWVKVLFPFGGGGPAYNPMWMVRYQGLPIISSYMNVLTDNNNNDVFTWNYVAAPESLITYSNVDNQNINVRMPYTDAVIQTPTEPTEPTQP